MRERERKGGWREMEEGKSMPTEATPETGRTEGEEEEEEEV